MSGGLWPSGTGSWSQQFMDGELMRRLVMRPGDTVGNVRRLLKNVDAVKPAPLPSRCLTVHDYIEVMVNPYRMVVASTRTTSRKAITEVRVREASIETSTRTTVDLYTDLQEFVSKLKVGAAPATVSGRMMNWRDDWQPALQNWPGRGAPPPKPHK